jgi:hypothetical protein
VSTEVALVDLDIAAPPDRRVKVAGNIYRVPGDPPTGWLLAFRSLTARFADESADELEIVAQLRDALVDLFCLRQPDKEQEVLEGVDSLGVPVLVQAVNSIYTATEAPIEEEQPAARPTRPAGTRSTSPSKRRASSASSSSSGS